MEFIYFLRVIWRRMRFSSFFFFQWRSIVTSLANTFNDKINVEISTDFSVILKLEEEEEDISVRERRNKNVNSNVYLLVLRNYEKDISLISSHLIDRL